MHCLFTFNATSSGGNRPAYVCTRASGPHYGNQQTSTGWAEKELMLQGVISGRY